MANAQLISYIKQQLELGETEAPIKNSLRSVGWADPDINDAFKAAGAQAPAASAQKAAPFAEPKKFINLNNFGSSPAVAGAGAGAGATAAPEASSKPAFPAPGNSSSSDAFFKPKSAGSAATLKTEAATLPVIKEKKSMAWIPVTLLSVLFLASSVVAFMFFRSNAAMKESLAVFESQVSSIGSELSGSSQNLTQLTSEVTALKEEKQDAESQLALFLPLTYVSSTVGTSTVNVAVPITLRGVLSGGENVPYTLKTTKGILVGLKNYSVEGVKSMLDPFLSSEVQLTGTPTSGAREITITAVNGSPIQ